MANKVKLTDLNADVTIKNTGINLQVVTDGKHRGHLVISKACVRWYKGKSQTPHEIRLDDFIAWMEEEK